MRHLSTAGTARPVGWERAFEALLLKPKSSINRKIMAQLDKVMSGLQSPKLYGQVLGEALEMVRRGEFADINAALRAMAESSGLKVVSVNAIKEGGSFFKDVVSKPAYWLEDNALKLEAPRRVHASPPGPRGRPGARRRRQERRVPQQVARQG